MCGICGFIGESTEPEASFELITQLFAKTEVRGKDASGFWGTEEGDGRILYHKEPTKSSEFIKTKIWKKVGKTNPNLLLVHTRAASPGVGVPSINKNNHPFVSADRSVGLIHNGKVPNIEYTALKEQYEVDTGCDSEMLLRLFEQRASTASNGEPEPRLDGMKDIWSFMGGDGFMAVAIGERLEHGLRRLWFFRNKWRSLWLADLRHILGQVFFFSTVNIWHEAMSHSPLILPYWANIKLIEVPTEQIWRMEVSPDYPVVQDRNLQKVQVSLSQFSKSWNPSGEKLAIPQARPVAQVITKLDDECNVVGKAPVVTGYAYTPSKPQTHTPSQLAAEAAKKNGTSVPGGATAGTHQPGPPLAASIPPKPDPKTPQLKDDTHSATDKPNPYGSISVVVPDGVKEVKDGEEPEGLEEITDGGAGDTELITDAELELIDDPADDEGLDDGDLDDLGDDVGLMGMEVPFDTQPSEHEPYQYDVSDHKVSIKTLNDSMFNIRNLIDDIETTAENKVMEGSVATGEFNDLVINLEQMELDLKGTLQILQNH